MKIKFWGVRGSIPTPLSPEKIQSKIQAVVQRITEKDIKDIDSREKFIASLPDWINGTVGGNTSCVELIPKSGESIILDCGSGMRALGKKMSKEGKTVFHIFFSHFHWDHIQGLPFFDPAFNPRAEIHFYSPRDDIRDYLDTQMTAPVLFPVPLAAFSGDLYYHTIEPGEVFQIGSLTCKFKKMKHPGDSYSYSFEEDGKKFIYATDVELIPANFEQIPENSDFFKNADVILMDAQYTATEAIEKMDWGHSSYCYCIDFASLWNIKKLMLFHHEPMYDDKKLYSILQAARWYANYSVPDKLEIDLSIEGNEVEI